jgi:hypothetical protein
LLDKTQFTVSIWDTGTPEAFLIHVQTAVSACKRKGLFSDFEDATDDVVNSNEKIVTYREVIATAKAGKEKGTTVEPPSDAMNP